MANRFRILLATLFAPVLPLMLTLYGHPSEILMISILVFYVVYFLFGIPLILTLRKNDNLKCFPLVLGSFVVCIMIGTALEFLFDQPLNMNWNDTVLIVDGSRTFQGYMFSLKTILIFGIIGSIIGSIWWLIGVAGVRKIT